MSGLFLSYSRADRALAEQIVRAMRAIGVSAWWDEDMGNVDWQQELAERIHDLSGVLVIWTEESQKSVHVRDEARLALQTDKLVNVMHGVTSPPFPFDRINGFHLDDWSGRDPHRGWTRVVAAVEELVVQKGGAKPGEITVAQAMREEQLQGARKAITTAQANLKRLQVREAEAGDEKKRADSIVEQAQEQLQRIAEMRATPVLLRAAQQEFDTAFEAREDAASALQKTRREFERASNALATAMETFETLVAAPEPLAKVTRPAPAPRPTSREREEPEPRVTAEPEPRAPPPPSRTRAAASPRPPRPKRTAALPLEAPLVMAPPAVEAPTPAPAAAVAAPMPPSSRAVGNRSLIVAGIAVGLALVAGAIFLVVRPPAGGATTASAAPAPAPTVAAPPAAVQALVGPWTLAGLDCDAPITVGVEGDQLTVTGLGSPTSATIENGAPAGTVRTHGAAGDASYTVRQGRMTVVNAAGRTTYTRCAGS